MNEEKQKIGLAAWISLRSANFALGAARRLITNRKTKSDIDSAQEILRLISIDIQDQYDNLRGLQFIQPHEELL